MDKILPLFRSDIFVKENVGTEEQREDLKKQILHAKENDIGINKRFIVFYFLNLKISLCNLQ